MLYVTILVMAIWVGVDAKKRQNNYLLWLLGSLTLPVFIIPVYFAVRHLREGEIRQGGTGWNIFRNFVLVWSLFMISVALTEMSPYVVIQETFGNASVHQGASGVENASVRFFWVWFLPVLGAALIGRWFRNHFKVEVGPTGKLALREKQEFLWEE